MTRIRSYSFKDWTLARQDDSGVVYRPGMRTLLGRLGATLLAALIFAGTYVTYSQVAQPRVRQRPPNVAQEADFREMVAEGEQNLAEMEQRIRETQGEAAWEDYQARKLDREQQYAARDAKVQADRDRADNIFTTFVEAGTWVCWAVMGLCALVGVIAPLSCLWNRVSIQRDPWGKLVVRKVGVLLPSTRAWPMETFGTISVLAQEVVVRSKAHLSRVGWRWRIMMTARPDPQAVGPYGSTITSGEPLVEFVVDQQKDRPSEGFIPKRVGAFLTALCGITGLTYFGPTISDYDYSRRRVGTPVRTAVSTSQPIVTRQTFRSADEVPPHLRARFEEMRAAAERQRAQPGQPLQSTIQSFSYRDAQGRMHTYSSLGEMPPEIRARYEEMLRRLRPPSQ